MRVGLLVGMLLAVGFAGCTDPPQDDDGLAAAVQELDVVATSDTGVIRGVVVDTSITPVPGVLIEIFSLGINATSNEAGAFGFEGLQPGTYFLQASRADYTSVQQSVEVVAGVQAPDAVRIQIAAIPRGEPFVEAISSLMFISGAGWVQGVGGVTAGGFGVVEGNFQFSVAITPNGTLAQTELIWDMTTPLGEVARAQGGTYASDDGLDTDTWYGPSPLVMRANATEDDGTADEVAYSFWGWPSAGTPIGMHINQKVDAFVHVFHNFRPNEGWQFSRDGEHPLPP